MTRGYDDIPLARSEHGALCYALGRDLVERAGIHPDQIMWDADEVLWDWMMSAPRVLARLPWLLATRSLGHREYFLVRPGIFELLWGMHHAAVDAGHPDPWLRIWTNGYPWRLWAIAEQVPGFAELLGAPADQGRQAFVDHPRIFYRTDFARVAALFVERDRRRAMLAGLPDAARAVLAAQFATDKPLDSNLKLPELATLTDDAGRPIKAGFDRVGFLVDDRGANIKRFIASGRRGVRVVSRSPWAFFGRIPNTTWGHPVRVLGRLDNHVTEAIAVALAELAGEPPPASRNATSDGVTVSMPASARLGFTLDIPGDVLHTEWVAPLRELRRRWIPDP